MGVDLKKMSVRTPGVPILYCSEWLWKFLVQAFGLFHSETGRESLKLAKGAKDKWRSHLKLMEWVF